MNQNRLLQDYFGRRPYPGTGVLEDYMQPAPVEMAPAGLPMQRLGLSPRAEMGIARYQSIPGVRGFSRANAERLYAQEQAMQEQALAEEQVLNEQLAAQAVTQVNPLSPQYSQQLTGILGKYGQAAVPALKGILPLQEVLRKAAEPEQVVDPYLNKITDPRAFQSYRQRRASGMEPEQAWAQTLVETEEDDLMTQALEAGIPLSQVQSMRQNGRLDRYKVLEATSAAKRSKPAQLKAPRSLELKALSGLHDAVAPSLGEPSPEEKQAWIESQGLNPKDEKAWEDAYNAVAQQKQMEAGPQAEEFLMGIQDLVEGGYRVPEKYQKLAQKLGFSVGQTAAAPVAQQRVDPFAGGQAPLATESRPNLPVESAQTSQQPVPIPPSAPPQMDLPDDFRSNVTSDELKSVYGLMDSLTDDEINTFVSSGIPDNPTNPQEVSQASDAQDLEMKNLLEKSGMADTPQNRRLILLTAQAKTDPIVVRYGGMNYKFPTPEKAAEFRKALAEKFPRK